MMGRNLKSLGLFGLCLAILAGSASAAVTDPNIITGAAKISSVAEEELLIVNGGLVTGAKTHIDRTYLFGDANDLSGIDFLMTAVDDKTNAGLEYSVTVDKAGTLFLLIDNRVGDDVGTNPPTLGGGVMDWVDAAGFVQTEYQVAIPEASAVLTAYALPVTAGTTTLYQQDDGGSRVTYLAAAIPDGWNLRPSVTGVPSSVQVPIGGTLAIDATVQDFGADTSTTILWEQTAGEAVAFAPDTASEDVTVSFPGEGEYTLKMTVTDGDGSSTVKTVNVSVTIPRFFVTSNDWAEICNDTQLGPDSTRSGDSIYARNYTNAEGTTTRRRIFFYNWDISSIKKPGEVFYNSYLTMYARSIQGNPTVHVFGVKEDLDDFEVKGYATWNNMPGVITGLPVGTLIDETVLDREDIVPLMEVVYSDYGSSGEWVDLPGTAALDEFLNADTDGSIMLMFAVLEEGKNFEVWSPNGDATPYEYNGSTYEGIFLQGNQLTPTWATNPSPQINSTQNTGLDQLEWTQPPAVGTVTCEAWIGLGDPNTPVGSGDGFVSLPVNGNTASLAGYSLEVGNTYNWVVNCTDDGTGVTTQGFMWSFYVGNGYPVVEVQDMYLWLGNDGDPGSATASINATVSDEGLVLPEPILLWEQLSGPATVVIDPNNVEDITLTLPATGTYVFKLTADDGELTSAATTNILVAETACKAAQAHPDYEPIMGDLDENCLVDLVDFSMLAVHWLECNATLLDIGGACN